MARYFAKIVKQEVEDSVKELVLAQSSSPTLGSDSPSDNVSKNHKHWKSKKEWRSCRPSVFLLDRNTWFLKELMREVTKVSELPTMNSDAADKVSKIKILHTTDSHFQNVASYKAYRLLEKSEA